MFSVCVTGSVAVGLRRDEQDAPGRLDECLETLMRDRPRIVGFTSIFQQHTASLALARRLKRQWPSTFVVFGGANCEGVMGAETVRSFPYVDAAVSGEADLVFPDLVRRVLDGVSVSDLPGVRTRDRVERALAFGNLTNRAACCAGFAPGPSACG